MTDTIHEAPGAADDGRRDCARGDHCSARTDTVEAGERTVAPARTYRTFCAADEDRITDCLKELPAFYLGLAARLGEKGGATGQRVSGGGTSRPVPINLGIEAFMRTVDEVVLSWEERVRDAASLAAVSVRRSSPAAIKAACGVLAAHATTLLTLDPADMQRSVDLARVEHLPDDAYLFLHPTGEWIRWFPSLGGAEAGVEVLNLHHRCLRMLGRTPQHHDLITPCWVDTCQERALRRHDGTAGLADFVECRRCGEQYLGGRLRALMVDEEQAQRRKQDRQHRADEGHARVLHGSKEGFGGRP